MTRKLLELVAMVVALVVVGTAFVWGAKAVVRYHDRVAQPVVSQVACHLEGGRISISGRVTNRSGSRRYIAIQPRFRLADGKLRGLQLGSGRWIAGHASREWRYVGSGVPRGQLARCGAGAWVDDD